MFDMCDREDSTVLSGRYTARQAAGVLGVSAHQVVQLIHAGELKAVRTAGGVFLVDAVSVASYAHLRKGRGRPFSAGVAWASLWLLSGLEVDWLSYQQRRRLLLKLCEVSADELAWLARRRARLLRLCVDESFFEVAQMRLVLSGVSSKSMLNLGLTMSSNRIEGYVSERDLDAFMCDCFAVAGENANIILRAVSDEMPVDLPARAEMPMAVVGVDLAASAVERERIAGIRMLEELLSEWRN